MNATTFRTMDTSDLGDNANATDLREFQTACRMRQVETQQTDAAVTEWMWNSGDWAARVAFVLKANS